MNSPVTSRSPFSHALGLESDERRILLFRNGGEEILVNTTGRSVCLPCIEVPRWRRVAEFLTGKMLEHYGLSAVCLFTLERSASSREEKHSIYEVMELWRCQTMLPEQMSWLPLDSWARDSFPDDHDAA